MALNQELPERGELVDAQGLAWPDQAKFVVSDGTGARVIIDGPFPESKELLAGYRIVDIETAERAIEIAPVSAAPGADGVPIRHPIEVGQVLSGPRPRGVTGAGTEGLPGELAPRVVRRDGDFARAEDAVQEALSTASTTATASIASGLTCSSRPAIPEAIAEFRAAARTANLREQHYLTTQAARLAGGAGALIAGAARSNRAEKVAVPCRVAAPCREPVPGTARSRRGWLTAPYSAD